MSALNFEENISLLDSFHLENTLFNFMGTIQKFEDLHVWQESMNLAEVLILNLDDFRIFSLRNQIIKSAISIPSNVAEGFEKQRHSNKEFIRLLYIAKGSAGELKTQLLLLQKLNRIISIDCEQLILQVDKISSMLGALINTRLRSF